MFVIYYNIISHISVLALVYWLKAMSTVVVLWICLYVSVSLCV